MDPVQLIQSIYGTQEVRYLVALIAANVGLGVVGAIGKGAFDLTRLADWLRTRAVPLLGGYGAAVLLSRAQPELAALATAAYVTVVATLLGHVLGSLREFGIPLPDALAGRSDGP